MVQGDGAGWLIKAEIIVVTANQRFASHKSEISNQSLGGYNNEKGLRNAQH